MKKIINALIFTFVSFMFCYQTSYALEQLECMYKSDGKNVISNSAVRLIQSSDNWTIYITDSKDNMDNPELSTNWVKVYNSVDGTVQGTYREYRVSRTYIGGLWNKNYYDSDLGGFTFCPQGIKTNNLLWVNPNRYEIDITFKKSGDELVKAVSGGSSGGGSTTPGGSSGTPGTNPSNPGGSFGNTSGSANISPQPQNYSNLCSDNEGVIKAVKIIGRVVQICKWVVPFLIILFGMIDFIKVVISNDEKAMNKATKSLITRIIIGLVVLVLPRFLLVVMEMFNSLNVKDIADGSFGACTKCILDVSSCDKSVDTNNTGNSGAGGAGGGNINQNYLN